MRDRFSIYYIDPAILYHCSAHRLTTSKITCRVTLTQSRFWSGRMSTSSLSLGPKKGSEH